MWNLPVSGIEPVSPALAGRFLTTRPLGKCNYALFFKPQCSGLNRHSTYPSLYQGMWKLTTTAIIIAMAAYLLSWPLFLSYFWCFWKKWIKWVSLHVLYACPLEIGTCHWCLPPTSIRIKSCAVAAADFQHSLKRVGLRAKMRHCAGGKSSRRRLQTARHFQELSF